MNPLSITAVAGLRGEVTPIGDKSIAHRAVIVSALAKGRTIIDNFPINQDCLSTVSVLKALGVKIRFLAKRSGAAKIDVFGRGLDSFRQPLKPLFSGDSGTTLRLLLGVIAGQAIAAKFTAGSSLSRRPMSRVIEPLRLMGAEITAHSDRAGCQEYPPVVIRGRAGGLHPINYRLPVASAQVKSAILFAGLYAKGRTRVTEPIPTRDHTERMLKLFGARILRRGKVVSINGAGKLSSPGRVYVPGDISSASFFIVLGLIHNHADIIIRRVSFNPTRIGMIRVLGRMGAGIKPVRSVYDASEPYTDLVVKSSRLKGARVSRQEVPALIDELPILLVAACFAKGKSVFEGIGELRVKETDRVRSMVTNLCAMGASIRVVNRKSGESIVVEGKSGLIGTKVRAYSDHRTAMSLIIAGLNASGKTVIDDSYCINKSFPGFMPALLRLGAG